ncbi:MAG: tetratricopeptide repeat protein [Ottowia sp.]|nr:tetratricopeptide repeat protein [Ottowia sp.]
MLSLSSPWQRPRLGAWFAAAFAAATLAGCAAGLGAGAAAPAEPEADEAKAAPAAPSRLDAPLLYELLLSEMTLDTGNAKLAARLMLDAANRVGEEPLYRRAAEMALFQREGGIALEAVRAWRQAWPQSASACQLEMQVLIALGRTKNIDEPLRCVLGALQGEEKQALIIALPALLQRVPDQAALARSVEEALGDVLKAPPELAAAAWTTVGRLRLSAGDKQGALQAAHLGRAADATSEWPALLAAQLVGEDMAEAETLLQGYLQSGSAKPELHLAWARALVVSKRSDEAREALRALTRRHPDYPEGWLLLGALLADEQRDAEAQDALRHYLKIVEKGSGKEDASDGAQLGGADQARMTLARLAERRGDEQEAERWLQEVRAPEFQMGVRVRRAALLAKRGELAQARQLIRSAPEREADDARTKLLAEAQLLQEHEHEQDAWELLRDAAKKSSKDETLLYEAALAAERAGHSAEMERLLRRIIRINPESAQALNALGYSFADRNVRLKEARSLIERAVRLMPDDAFIQDSLGWVDFRQGNVQRARQILQKAWDKQPHPEIAAHLGEVLWVQGERDAARAIWREGVRLDAKDKTLRRVMQRFGVEP